MGGADDRVWPRNLDIVSMRGFYARIILLIAVFVGFFTPTSGAVASFAPSSLAAKTTAVADGRFTVGAYNEIRGTVAGMYAHHVGQQALMKRLVPGYDPATAPSILVPKVGHTIRGPNGIISRSTSGLDNARHVIARDICCRLSDTHRTEGARVRFPRMMAA
jgi:hypothetical protein